MPSHRGPRPSRTLPYLLPLLLAACLPPADPPATRRPPNVVVVVVDALRADRLGIAGYPRPTTPTIDALAAEGVYFDAAFAQATWTKPSIATLFTSLYPSEHGLLQVGREEDGGMTTDALGRDATTLAERFATAGYATFAAVNQVHLQRRMGFGQGFGAYEWRRGKTGFDLNRIFADWLVKKPPEPIFAYLHYLDVHWPYDSRLAGVGTDVFGRTWMRRPPPNGLAHVAAWRESALDAPALAALKARYDHEVRFADAAIADLVGVLAAAAEWDETLLVVTADHGEGFLEHGELMHGYAPYDEVARVPLVLRLPASVGTARGARLGPVGLVDLGPTLLELAGVATSEPVGSGRSFAGLVAHDETAGRTVFVQSEVGWAVRTATHKLIAFGDGRREFFDLERDPGETANLAASECAGVCLDLAGELRAFRSRLKTSPHRLDRERLSDEDIRELEALGYL